ncbi:hypothetical protein [Methylobacterium variabile]|jgi:maleylacetoacetate isomerase|uniref:hypothetical protein n=1 Tax=Methylobacterium variabile TaxID=298794 RepID=UPI000A58E35B
MRMIGNGRSAMTAIFGVDTAPYPTVRRIAEDCLSQDAFAKAHPKRQPRAPA